MSQELADRVAYKTELDAQEPIEELAAFKNLNGVALSLPQLQTLNTKIDFYLRHGRDEAISGLELPNLVSASNWVRAVDALDDVSNWERNLNSYRSLCRVLGMPVAAERLCSPRRWRFAATSYIDIRINDTDLPLAANDVILHALIDEGQRLVNEVETVAAHNPGKVDSVDMLVHFLLAEYSQALREVETAVSAIHSAQLLAVGASLRILPDLELLRLEIRHALSERPKEVFGDKNARPVKLEETVWPEAPPPVTAGVAQIAIWDDWAQRTGLDVCVPSVRKPEKWPALNPEANERIVRSWQKYDLESAIVAEALGLGKLSIEYQVQIESIHWANLFDLVLGIPTVYYFLFMKTPSGRKWIAASVAKLRGEPPVYSICYEPGGQRLTPLGVVTNAQKSFLALRDTPYSPPEFEAVLAQPHIAGARYTSLTEDIVSRYADIGNRIHAELSTQLDTPDSPLGSAVRRVTRVSDIIRGTCTWLLPAALSDAGLRTSLFGSAARWASFSIKRQFDIPEIPPLDLVAFKEFDIPAIPLLDLAAFKELLASGSEQEAQDWSEVVTLQPVKLMGELSLKNFVSALRKARALTSDQPLQTEIAESLRELKAVHRFFGVTG